MALFLKSGFDTENTGARLAIYWFVCKGAHKVI
jgi:hypothetical protein